MELSLVDGDGTASLRGLSRAVSNARRWLLDCQHSQGYWEGELEGDTILESEYILLLAFLGKERSQVASRAADYLLHQQLSTGGWAIYPGGELEISASVKAYFALKVTGHDPASEPLRRARTAILACGGADAVNSFTRYYLALLGQISYEQCPSVPPETVLLPRWLPINLYKVSAWSRTIIVPLSIMSACRPVTQVAASRGIRELFLKRPEDWPQLRCPGLQGGTGLFSWDRFFRRTDRGIKWLERMGLLPRRTALAAAERWMLTRFEGSDGLGAIFPPMVWSVIALKCLGYADDSPQVQYCHRQLEGLFLEDERGLRLQPCKSPVWDTAIALRALADGGVSHDHPSVQDAIAWLLQMEILRRGDWSKTVEASAGGWCFEHANEFYPDLDDTSMVAMALAEQFNDKSAARQNNGQSFDHGRGLLKRATQAIDRAEKWMLAMQNRDGGWGAFDKDNDRKFLCHVPFADHNAMIDPSTPDLAARVLECLGKLGRRAGDPAVDRAIAYLRRTQEADGSWFGRWGVNYIYGTWQVLTGLAAVGIGADDVHLAAGAQWLFAHQQPCGGWGESPDSYADPRKKGQGVPTPSQTAWALLGLIAAGLRDHPAVARGANWLVDRQNADGDWDESEFTGTGFPRVFYLRYHLYRVYFPLMALGRCQRGEIRRNSESPALADSFPATMTAAQTTAQTTAI